jgi:AraC-like DNA-binding protein
LTGRQLNDDLWEITVILREFMPDRHLARPGPPANIAATPDYPVHAERFRAALQARVLGLAGLNAGGSGVGVSFRALHLERGSATLTGPGTGPDDERVLDAPMTGWFPWADDLRLHLAAGAQGTHLLLGPAALDRALRHHPEAAHLRYLAGRIGVLRLSDTGNAPDRVASCFDGILAETLRPGPMSASVVASLVHVLLVQFYRGQAMRDVRSDAGGGTSLAAQLIALVEENFRAHWSVDRYAARLGVSRDRLTDICQRVHDRPPGALIRGRLALEARLYLESSPLSLDQIAGRLGFAGPAQFSRFVRAVTGLPPGRYRQDNRRVGQTAGEPAAAPYAWP